MFWYYVILLMSPHTNLLVRLYTPPKKQFFLTTSHALQSSQNLITNHYSPGTHQTASLSMDEQQQTILEQRSDGRCRSVVHFILEHRKQQNLAGIYYPPTTKRSQTSPSWLIRDGDEEHHDHHHLVSLTRPRLPPPLRQSSSPSESTSPNPSRPEHSQV